MTRLGGFVCAAVRSFLRLGLLASLFGLAGCKSGTPAIQDADDVAIVKSFVFKHDGILRDVVVADPRASPGESLRPLVVVLHGGLGEDDDTVKLSFGKLNALAEEEDFLVVYPAGVGGHWNDGRRVDSYVAQREGVDDVGFLTTLIRDLLKRKQVDPQGVFLVGVSDGAMMAHRFACERTGLLTAFTSVIGAMPRPVARRKARCGDAPISVLMINGADDPIVPFDGGMVRFDGVDHGEVISVEDTFLFWRNHEQCADVDTSMLPDFSPADGSRIARRKATGCRGSSKVELFVVEGAGHTWPSGWQYLPETMVGRTSNDIDAAVATWRFFQSTL